MEIITFIVPDWAMCYLVNGDCSGLGDGDIAKVNIFTQNLVDKYGHGIVSFEENEGFKTSNDICDLGTDCSVVTLIHYP